MPDLNQNLYNASYSHLKSVEVPEYLADAASRIVATDDANKTNLGRNQVDIEVCKSVATVLNNQEEN